MPNQFHHLQIKLNPLTEEFKEKYYVCVSNKLLDPKTNPRSCWSILKIFLNNKKIPCIYHCCTKINWLIAKKKPKCLTISFRSSVQSLEITVNFLGLSPKKTWITIYSPFHSNGLFLFPLKTSGGKERNQWHEMF